METSRQLKSIENIQGVALIPPGTKGIPINTIALIEIEGFHLQITVFESSHDQTDINILGRTFQFWQR